MNYPTVAEIIAHVESENSICAIRFEPEIEKFDPPTLVKISRFNKCSSATAKEIYASSFGKFQILGETLYSTLGYEKPIQVFFADETEQIAMFEKFLKIEGLCTDGMKLLSSPSEREIFARKYNGP